MSRTRKARVLAPLVAALAAVLATSPAQAGSVTKSYDVSAGALRYSVDDPSGGAISADKTIDIGGIEFNAIGGSGATNITVRAKDEVNAWGFVSLAACQDVDDDAICGETADGVTQFEDEPSVGGCVKGDGSGPGLTLAGAKRNTPTAVFVRALWGCPTYLVPDVADQQGGGVRGTVTLSWT